MRRLVSPLSAALVPVRTVSLAVVGVLLAFPLLTRAVAAQDEGASLRARVAARGKALELPGAWTPPPGDALVHHTSGFAKTLCSAVFITGLDPQDAAANVGFFTGPLEYRRFVVDT